MGAIPTYTAGTAPSQGDFQWGLITRPVFYATQNVVQTGIVTATFTAVNLQNVVIDRDSQHTTSTSGRVNIGKTLGFYRCSGMVAFAAMPAGNTRRGRLVFNGGSVVGSQGTWAANNNFGSCVVPPVIVQATASGDYVELQCWHDRGANSDLAVSGGDFESNLLVEWIGS